MIKCLMEFGANAFATDNLGRKKCALFKIRGYLPYEGHVTQG